ncbi:MAG: glucosaminidase domain-containing protein [Clostridia bacterium]|nr:glucosaminidase domain-containing protein [Clostridia bacterium]
MDSWLRKVLTTILTITLVLAMCWGILCLCVSCGVKAFAAEFPPITEPCGMSTEELEAVLKGNLKQYAQEFLHAEEDYHINACFLASIAALESGWGEHQFKTNNIFGFGQKEFLSIPHCIDYVAWFLRKHYINENGRYYRGGTIADIGRIWCPDDGEWVRLVTGIYGGMIND